MKEERYFMEENVYIIKIVDETRTREKCKLNLYFLEDMLSHVFNEKVEAVMSDPRFIGSTSDAESIVREVYFLKQDLSEMTTKEVELATIVYKQENPRKGMSIGDDTDAY